MKNIFLTIIGLLAVTQLSFAKTSNDSTSSNIAETERIVDKYTDRVSQAIQGLAEALKVPAEHVYRVLVKQQIAEAVSHLFIIAFFLILCVTVFYSAYKVGAKENWSCNDCEFYGGTCVVSVILIILTCGHLLFSGADYITQIINPEYGAIQEILQLLK